MVQTLGTAACLGITRNNNSLVGSCVITTALKSCTFMIVQPWNEILGFTANCNNKKHERALDAILHPNISPRLAAAESRLFSQ